MFFLLPRKRDSICNHDFIGTSGYPNSYGTHRPDGFKIASDRFFEMPDEPKTPKDETPIEWAERRTREINEGKI